MLTLSPSLAIQELSHGGPHPNPKPNPNPSPNPNPKPETVIPHLPTHNLPPSKNSPTVALLFFFFITLEPRVEWYTKFMSLKNEPSSEPLHISAE